MNKKVKAPAGYHWMKSGAGYKLMKILKVVINLTKVLA